jgi:probable HAF family extracellular repeat protein
MQQKLNLAIMIAIASCCPSLAQTYSVTDLGTLGGPTSAAYGINTAGEVTGIAALTSGLHAFVASGGKMTDLGTLGGEYSQGEGINSFGSVVGYSTLADGSYRAFMYTNGLMTSLGTLGANYSAAYAVNDAGQVVGASITSTNLNHAFLYSRGQMTDLGTLGGNQPGWSTVASGISASGQVVGYSYRTDGNFHGFLYMNGVMQDLGTLGGSWSQAYAINNAGQIAGQAYLPRNAKAHAFLHSGGKMTDLGAFHAYSSGLAVNSSGVVVGQADIKNSTGLLVYHAVIFTNGKPQDLNKLIPVNSGWVLSSANSVNDAGQIVGYGTLHGAQHAFLLTPH